jgi:hypothetical protein
MCTGSSHKKATSNQTKRMITNQIFLYGLYVVYVLTFHSMLAVSVYFLWHSFLTFMF